MANKYDVSIITPAFKPDQKLFYRAFDSVVGQTCGFDKLEWIIVVHNSDDSYYQMVIDKTSAYDNIKVLRLNNDNHTASSPRNYALPQATGDYIAFLDCDDFYNTELFEKVVPAMREHDGDFGSYRYECLSESGIVNIHPYMLIDQTKDLIVIDTSKPWDSSKFIYGAALNVTAKIYKRKFIEDNGFRFDEKVPLAEDNLFNLHCFTKAKKILFFPQLIGYEYWMNQGSLVQSFNKRDEKVLSYATGVKQVLSYAVTTNLYTDYVVADLLGYISAMSMSSTKLSLETRNKICEMLSPFIHIVKKINPSKLYSSTIAKSIVIMPSLFIGKPKFCYRLAKTLEALKIDLGSLIAKHASVPSVTGITLPHKNNISQEELLFEILDANKDTDYGKCHYFSNIRTIDSYQTNVPPTNYDVYAPLVELMTRLGEHSIFTAQDLYCFTEFLCFNGEFKILPCTEDYAELCFESLRDVLTRRERSVVLWESKRNTEWTRNNGYTNTIYGVMLEKWLDWKNHTFGIKRLEYGNISTPYTLLFPDETGKHRYAKALFAVADSDISQIIAATTFDVLELVNLILNRWQDIINDIANGTISDDTLSDETRKALMKDWRANIDRANYLRLVNPFIDSWQLTSIWPFLKRIVADGSAGLSLYTRHLKKYAEDIIFDYGTALDSEALYARNIENTDLYELLPEINFYEFRKLKEDDNKLSLDDKFILLDELEVNELYAVYVTTRYGFYRYKLDEYIYIEEKDEEKNSILLTRQGKEGETIVIGNCCMTQNQIAEAIMALEDKQNIYIRDYVCIAKDNHVLVLIDSDDAIDETNIEQCVEELFKKYILGYAVARANDSLKPVKVGKMKPYTQNEAVQVFLDEFGLSPDLARPAKNIKYPLAIQFFESHKIS